MKLRISLIFFTLLFAHTVSATESSGSVDTTPTKHSEHPPHDHHDPDHLKYIRREEKWKKKKQQ